MKYERIAEGATEVDIVAGDILTVASAEGEWWYGSSVKTGKTGYFPSSYVEIVDLNAVLQMAAGAVTTTSATPSKSKIDIEQSKGVRVKEEKRTVQTGVRGATGVIAGMGTRKESMLARAARRRSRRRQTTAGLDAEEEEEAALGGIPSSGCGGVCNSV